MEQEGGELPSKSSQQLEAAPVETTADISAMKSARWLDFSGGVLTLASGAMMEHPKQNPKQSQPSQQPHLGRPKQMSKPS
ncbi:Hypothetical predicted protein [Olea europaea subsp. europaea]|uniref:Uncharacterized protein n=1 Tax=Olea europaea subsp. europaea TaxID=158383 RepID=A0A8S0U601_OLEEU|nr:Hypothetical predicted protein [Olea europaea subsp. europaea]